MPSSFPERTDTIQNIELTPRASSQPIHAPGAIQAFGVLIAFEEEENERLVVRQVSEVRLDSRSISPDCHVLTSSSAFPTDR
jgi:light-regulated signal transduction histidine kinase (bacteriophytochrome)